MAIKGAPQLGAMTCPPSAQPINIDPYQGNYVQQWPVPPSQTAVDYIMQSYTMYTNGPRVGGPLSAPAMYYADPANTGTGLGPGNGTVGLAGLSGAGTTVFQFLFGLAIGGALAYAGTKLYRRFR